MDDIFSRTEYRRVIAWPERIRREAPFFEAVFADAAPRRILDVGCGTGEHTRHFAEKGWQAVGIDISEKMIEDATELAGTTAAGGSARFELRDAAAAAGLPEAPFGAALCVGNMLAYQERDDETRRMFAAIASVLVPGARLLVQLLNYERIRSAGIRQLPLNFRPLPEEEGAGEIVFLRIFTPHPDGSVDFYPVTLTLRPGAEPPVEIRSARQGKHRGWTRAELEQVLTGSGFGPIVAYGGMSEAPFVPGESHDLVLVATRRGG